VELKTYFNALKRRWLIIVLLPLIVGLGAVAQEVLREPTYSTEFQASVIRQPEAPTPGEFDFNRYYNYLASEFAIDDLVVAVEGNVFAAGVADRLPPGSPIAVEDVQRALESEREHRVLKMTVSSGDMKTVDQVAQAAMMEVQDNAFMYLGIDGVGATAVVEIVQTPGTLMTDSGRARLLLLLQVIAALGAAVLLAFFVDYLDDTLYDAESTANILRMPHLASVPTERRT